MGNLVLNEVLVGKTWISDGSFFWVWERGKEAINGMVLSAKLIVGMGGLGNISGVKILLAVACI